MKKKSSNPYKKPPVTPYDAYVPHPRYGREPRYTRLDVDPRDPEVHLRGVSDGTDFDNTYIIGGRHHPLIKVEDAAYWLRLVTHATVDAQARNKPIAGTALVADPRKLLPDWHGRKTTHYWDFDRLCRRCNRRFIFFAAEQKYWYEELRFPEFAEAWECVECRKALHEILELRKRYEELVTTRARTEAQTMDLVECAATLIEAGVFSPKGIPRLRGFLNRIDRNPAEGTPLRELKARLGRLRTTA